MLAYNNQIFCLIYLSCMKNEFCLICLSRMKSDKAYAEGRTFDGSKFYVISALYQELGERGNQLENDDYQRKKIDDLHKRLADAHASIHHLELVSAQNVAVDNLYATVYFQDQTP